jgi:protein-S-isoprenylcysteine O-methyltransferase Ste14
VNNQNPVEQPNGRSETTRGVLRWLIREIFGVRIQDDRGHAVASSGPYRYVRHPGYSGSIAFELATPIMLGSLWALIPGGLTALLLLTRTALEDGTLLKELEGSKEYAEQVRYRLVPGVW